VLTSPTPADATALREEQMTVPAEGLRRGEIRWIIGAQQLERHLGDDAAADRAELIPGAAGFGFLEYVEPQEVLEAHPGPTSSVVSGAAPRAAVTVSPDGRPVRAPRSRSPTASER
jgi:hypothetical protein